ncbi:haloacid dehalogenase-like hydrolase [Actinokineospora sp. HUAS TT18]|uniref:haloacid dehalogenase-like hydrolase n=1 Tax=Actinokineospora sp. HUAS TT18 TaxID=3447451 RepID=UPI003F5259B9
MRVRLLIPTAALALSALGLAPVPSVAAAPRAECATLDPGLSWYGENRQRLDAMIAEHGRCAERPGPRPVAVFDWDNTVIRNDVGDATLFWMLRNSVVRQPADWAATSRYLTPAAVTALRSACGTAPAGRPLPTGTDTRCADEILAVYSTAATTGGAAAFAGHDHRRMEPAYAWLAQLLAGWTPADVRGFAAAAQRENLAAPVGATQLVGTHQVTGWVRYYDQQRDLVRTLRRAGFDIWVVSASPQPVVEVWAAGVGVGVNRVVGIRSVKQAGRFTHRLTGCGNVPDGADSVITYIDGKRCWINQEIYGVRGAKAFDRQDPARRPVFAAGDSTTDLTFVRDATALRLVINRNKTELMCHAYHDADGRWIVNPMLIQPKSAQAAPYPCSTKGATDAAGRAIPALDDAGHVIPDQIDSVH